MLSGVTVIAIFCLYMGLLFTLALWTSRNRLLGRNLVNSPLVYSLSLAVYCSSWTFFGSVGSAAASGMLFLTIYLGPTLVYTLMPSLVAKMVRIKDSHHITSIADFISARYEKSEGLAAAVTLLLLLGITPYVALQLKAVFASFAIITAHTGDSGSFVGANVGPLVVALMIVFTIAFGVSRLDPTERHEGMVMAVAAESLVKLVAALAAGIFVAYFLFDGLGDLFARIEATPEQGGPAGPRSMFTWFSFLILSANAVLLLPRQFHLTVVENQSLKHLKWAMWLLPVYLFLINFFVYPIAQAGLIQGFPLDQADTFVLQLPLLGGSNWLAVLVFIGGFSAATSMIMISSMAMSIMISNHLLLPLVDWFPQLRFIERHLLRARWVAVAAFIIGGFFFELLVGERYPLADMGIISFAAVLQLAPATLGGLFWRGGNLRGATLGLLAGFGVWFYTLLLPTVAESGLIGNGFMIHGPFGWEFLRPQAIFGLTGLHPVAHTVLWSMIVNIGAYILGSLATPTTAEAQSHAEAFVGAGDEDMFATTQKRQANILVADKSSRVEMLLARYFEDSAARRIVNRALGSVGLARETKASITQLAEFLDHVEKSLGGSIGTATAHRVMLQAELYTPAEAEELRQVYSEILAESQANPQELKRKMDYYREREEMIQLHSEELESKVVELEKQIDMRLKVEARLRESEERYRLAIEDSSDGVAVAKDGRMIFINRKLAEIFGYPHRVELADRSMGVLVHPDDRSRVRQLDLLRFKSMPTPSRFDFKGIRKDGTPIYIAVSAATHNYNGEVLDLIYLRDVTRRRRAEEDVRRLSRRLIEGIEEERRRLADDLHDEFGQALTGLHLEVESLADSLALDQADQRRKCDQLVEDIGRIADNLRQISTELRPDVLDHLGLVATVEWYLNDYEDRMKGVDVKLQVLGFSGRKLTPQTDIVLYRILQEALNNVTKHARATEVRVQLTYSHPQVIMVIRDNGVGFEQEREVVSADGRMTGVGLLSMAERVASVGGSIDIHSAKGKGTTIRLMVPQE